MNPWYYQCLSGNCAGRTISTTSTTSTTTSTPKTSSTTVVTTTTTSKYSTTTTTTTKPSSSSSSSSSTSSAASSPTATFTNPVVYADFADNDVFLGPDNVFYYLASNMHYSPGGPILKSYDLVNWELIGHAIPSIGDFGSAYSMTDNTTAYREGTWASTLRYRKSNGQWYWIGCVDFWITYIYTASSPTGPWVKSASMPGTCYYDCGLLIDDDDTMYVVYGGTNVSVAQLSPDGLSQVKTVPVFNAADTNRNQIEGNRMYKINGTYYVLDDDTQGTTIIWKSSSPFGPYTHKILIDNVNSPVPGGGTVDQGSLVQTQDGKWYFMSFVWAYPAGRMPILAPIVWGADGFPSLVTDSAGNWGASYTYPLTPHPLASWTGSDTFQGTSLSPNWEWNHAPDTTKYTVNNGLRLSTAAITTDLFHARNTLTLRPFGPTPVGTVTLDITSMADGDIAGLAALREGTSWIGVQRSGSSYTLQMRLNATQDSSTNWATVSIGTVAATAAVPAGMSKLWLRVAMDARATGSKQAVFYYSFDGVAFTQLGPSYTMTSGWEFFLGYRYGVFNFATKALGGSVGVVEFVSA